MVHSAPILSAQVVCTGPSHASLPTSLQHHLVTHFKSFSDVDMQKDEIAIMIKMPGLRHPIRGSQGAPEAGYQANFHEGTSANPGMSCYRWARQS